MKVGIVIPTAGRSKYLLTCLEAVAGQVLKPVHVVVADQSGEKRVSETVAAVSASFPIDCVAGGKGTSEGKNVGFRCLPATDIVVFLDDDCVLSPDFLVRLVGLFETSGADVVAGVVSTGGRTRVAFPTVPSRVSRSNVWKVTLEAATFYRSRLFESLGGFDESLGTGCRTRWQSGEGTELLLRCFARGANVLFDPSIVVEEMQDEISPVDYALKARRYARGTGRVYRLHYPVLERCRIVLRPFVGSILYLFRGRITDSRVKALVALGRLEGLL